MRTVFVNPTRRRAPKKKKAKRRNTTKATGTAGKLAIRNAFLRGKESGMQMVANPRRRKKAKKRRRSRRRNAGIVPFTAASMQANPLILNNPRRRRRRKNPSMNVERFAKKLMTYGGGSAIGAGANILALNKIEDMWFRNGARMGAATVAGIMIKGEMGAAAAGAMLYPVWQEVALRVMSPTEADLEADLDTLAADLEDLVDEYGDGEGGDYYDGEEDWDNYN